MASQLILVTGSNGFLGSHIVYQLLENGYRVRGTARGAKVAQVKDMFASYGDKFEAVLVSDIAVDDISAHLKGVDALIHSAAPLSGKGDSKLLLSGALTGSLNIIRQAEKAGIKKIVYTSTILTAFTPAFSFTDQDWNSMTEEETLAAPPLSAYGGAKTLAEKAIWKLADEHKHLDITVLSPPYLYGPFVPNFRVAKPDYGALSTNLYIYHFLTKEGRAFPPYPGYADVRDVARMHVGALTAAHESSVGRKRLPVAAPYDVDYKQALQFVADAHPEVRDRLVDANTVPEYPISRLPVDLKRVEEVTGVKVSSYYTWKETILDAMESVLALEKSWTSQGYEIKIPTLEEHAF